MYAGGLNVVAVEGSFNTKPKSYVLGLKANTQGLLGKLAPWKGILETTGRTTKADPFVPNEHFFSSWWRGDEERTTFVYGKSGEFKSLSIIEDGKDKATEDNLDPKLSTGTKDMLSALGVMLDHYRKTGSCEKSIPSFDGKRRFDIAFRDQGDAEVKKNRYSTFSGTARKCTVEIIPRGGKWREKPRGWMSIQEQNKKGGKLPTLWLAEPQAGIPAIPVRMQLHTGYGAIFMHLVGIE